MNDIKQSYSETEIEQFSEKGTFCEEVEIQSPYHSLSSSFCGNGLMKNSLELLSPREQECTQQNHLH